MDVQERFKDAIEQANQPKETKEEAVKRIMTCDESELNEGEYVEMGGVVVKGEKPKSKFWPILGKIIKGFFQGLWWLIKNILLLIPRILKLAK